MNNQIPAMQKQQGSYPRLNSQGANMGANTASPTSRIGVNNQRQVDVLYGHNKGGKAYTYLGSENLRVGDVVTPQVTHPKSGKDYRTLGRVVRTQDALGSSAANTSEYLSGNGIMMKTIGNTDQKSLPGFKAQLAIDPKFTAKQWKSQADADYKAKQMHRLNIMGEPM